MYTGGVVLNELAVKFSTNVNPNQVYIETHNFSSAKLCFTMRYLEVHYELPDLFVSCD